ncbi:50S ribosomal protein L33 [Rickettsiales endosymbiont of Paramecium tredecaurelia]|uniref:50S ribosomal protein L33 n=1 Tax=Candidatus Sarmatiella mevalonica TaxID=2770581 RepID=UPI001922EF99|nr:50S ribosomal protein L33 [Candidatus Sarmatiella mevalonica]MBL3284277.1 50S ribosomal protein L33 [Candidatus Sarmatiella mevalonica]
MSSKKRGKYSLVRLVSSEKTGTFIVAKKGKVKLQRRMYDPKIRKHVLFVEAKGKA